MIPQANPGASYRALQEQVDAAVLGVLASGCIILGGAGDAFETEFAAWLGTAFAVGCGNGTDALALALRGLGVRPGRRGCYRITHSSSHRSRNRDGRRNARSGRIDPEFYTIDPGDLAATLAHPPPSLPPIRAVIVVHLYGMAAELEKVLAIAARYGAVVIEDCAQAHGATYKGGTVGTLGHAGAFSFYPTKNLGALRRRRCRHHKQRRPGRARALLASIRLELPIRLRSRGDKQSSRRNSGGDPAGKATRFGLLTTCVENKSPTPMTVPFKNSASRARGDDPIVCPFFTNT